MSSAAKSAQISLPQLTQAIIAARDAGQRLRAFELACLAAVHPDAGHVQFLLLGEVSQGIDFKNFYPPAKSALTAAFAFDKVEHQKMAPLWGATFLLDPDLKEHSSIMGDPFVIAGLRKTIISKVAIEKIFTDLRRFFLLEVWPQKSLKTKDIAFLSALAEQCFLNEYVWYVTDEEIAAVKTLSTNDPIAVCLIGCYEPLHKRDIKPKLSAVAGYRQMMKTQVDNPRREEALKADIETLKMTGSDVSQGVQAMYEENPYPRWVSTDFSHIIYGEAEGRMLAAGCGTGRSLVQAAAMFPKMDITAIDITKASIAYAMRAAEEFGCGNIRFLQADIMAVDAMDKKFDFIECSGVLHHLADPKAGWAKLMNRLDDGGVMLISLYSTRVREVITAVREEARKYAPDPQGIRSLRAYIKSLPEDNPLKPVSARRDFFGMSDIRDLLFHVQEASYTLPEIKNMMDDLGLEFIGFKRAPLPEHAEERDLMKWHEFELQNPARFYGMYEFLCRRKGEALNKTAQFITSDVLQVK